MRLLILCFSLLTLVSARAQHHHFLYLQADQQQPFYVKMGSSVLSSSADGFLIIPRLRDSAVVMVVGFPSKKFPEYRFRFDGFRKDRGMALKDFGEKGWGLFDYQTLEIVMGEKIEEQRAVVPPPPVPLTNDPFTVVLASVIDDPGLLATPLVQMGPKEVYVQASAPVRNPPPVQGATVQSPVAAKNPAPAASGPPAIVSASKDSAALVPVEKTPAPLTSINNTAKADSTTVALQEKPSPPPVSPAVIAPSKDPDVTAVKTQPLEPGIRKVSEQERPAGRALIFVDLSAGVRPDTVDVFIPMAVAVASAGETRPAIDTAFLVKKSEEPSIPKPVVEESLLVKTDTTARMAEAKPKAPVAAERIITDAPDTVSRKPEAATSVDPQPAENKPDSVEAGPAKPVRSNCARMASEKDLQALRKRILGISDEDDMVSAALKDFKQRCYTTEQVRALSFVFLRQEGKYKLIDAVYPHIYDPANYGQLEALLTDKYFIHRFRALVQE
jgi:hypothetical protein